MKRLTKYKDGKFLLNHSSVNEAIDKLGKLEIIDELNRNKRYFSKLNDGSVTGIDIGENSVCKLDETTKNSIWITHYYYGGNRDVDLLHFFNYKKYWSLKWEDLE